MKTIKLSNNVKAENWDEVLIEAAAVLNKEAGIGQEFDILDGQILEYDLTETDAPIYWDMVTVGWNEDGTASHANLDC